MDTVEQPTIVAEDLSIAYIERAAGRPHEALSGATFTVEHGGILGVVGTAGSGKTALGRVLSGRGDEGRDSWPFISGGSLHAAGLDLRYPSRADRRRLTLDIGYLAQESGDGLRNDLTVGENIAEPILSRDRSFERRRLGRAAAMLIDAVDLELGMLNKFPFELSRGQRQRVALAQALIVEPKVLIVDEPAQGVDIIARPALFTLLERINAARQCTMVILSHDLATVQRLTEDILVLDRGFVIARGRIDDVLAKPDHPYLLRMREARDFARAPLPGLVERDALLAVDRVADGLFGDFDAATVQAEAAELAEEKLVEQRPEFARFTKQGED
ncbi:peptide/nickel transport system ATP-binding protein [Pseudoclavibacter chungangensis]|uniref:ATP-binding cassette domain-containing protein n=1 Tax=Pseudoclavibacter chungangensis TaxID=587635 RepID=UPI0015CE49CE|nr:ATP-binding cassette domain-containing protein [Pseudoclavibacter chungangensis]NYJ66310.1 peptide/nickel transport system ATP-binding protein [Pseudoclavibacter chungangensis]